MPAGSQVGARREARRTLEFGRLRSGALRRRHTPARQLGPRAHAELEVHPRERRLDRADGQEQLRRDLAVRLALRRERRDALLRRREAAGRRRTTADPFELAARLLRPERCRQLLERVEGVAECLTGGALVLPAALGPPEREERQRALEGGGEPGGMRD